LKQKAFGSKRDWVLITQIEKQHPAPFGFRDISRLIEFFTKKGQLVLDPFNGVGSTSKACAVTKRRSIGIELTKKWVDLSFERLDKEVGSREGQKIIHGDSREELKKFSNDYFDFIVTSPPYWKILKKKVDLKTAERVREGYEKTYSDDTRDLGNIESYSEFLSELSSILQQCYRVLKNKKYMVVIVSDFRHGSEFVPYHVDMIKIMEESKFELKGITILVQSHKSLKPYGYPFAYVPNIHHQYVLIFQKIRG
jgi:DNA modification methylase